MSVYAPGLSVREAADHLGVSPSAIRQLIAQGQVSAGRFAGRIVIDPQQLRQVRAIVRPAGRPFSSAASWALLRLLAGDNPGPLSPSRLSQLRRHLRAGDPQNLAGRLRKRAPRHSWYVHTSLLDALAAEPDCVRAGLSAAEQVGADLAGGDRSWEMYIDAGALDRLAREYAADADVPVSVANVGLRSVDLEQVPLHDGGVAAASVVALDLIESGEARAIGAGWALWHDLVAAWRMRDADGS